MVSGPWCTIIIPTLSDNPPTLKSLLSPEELEKLGIELVVSKDMGWRNASRTRNMGAATAKGEVLCFIDDDAYFDFEKLFQALQTIRSTRGCFIWLERPHVLIMRREMFFEAGGYDERFRPQMAEDVELRLRLKRMGYKELPYTPEMIDLRHLKEHPDPRYLLNQKHLTWAYLQHRTYPLWRLVWRKNPLEVARRIKWVLEWFLYRRYQKRSILSTARADVPSK